jgi:hypothetical protein
VTVINELDDPEYNFNEKILDLSEAEHTTFMCRNSDVAKSKNLNHLNFGIWRFYCTSLWTKRHFY